MPEHDGGAGSALFSIAKKSDIIHNDGKGYPRDNAGHGAVAGSSGFPKGIIPFGRRRLFDFIDNFKSNTPWGSRRKGCAASLKRRPR